MPALGDTLAVAGEAHVAKAKKTKPKRKVVAKSARSMAKPKPKARPKAKPPTKARPKAKPPVKVKAKKAAKRPVKAKAKKAAKRPVKAKAIPKTRPVKAKAKLAVSREAPAKPRPIAKPKPPSLESLLLEAIVLASPERVYTAWLDGAEHSAFTGGEAIIDAIVGGKHSAWSGYIEGYFLDLEPGRRIVMSWRTTEFAETDPDSRAEVRFSSDGGGTRIEIEHTELPPGGAQKYGTGWREFYFVPMRRYFESDQSGD